MNIFVLDESPELSARAQHDRHVVKMILESAQMLSGAVQHKDLAHYSTLIDDVSRETLYKPTHMNHPCSVWVREADENFVWLSIHLNTLLREYGRRFPGRNHACSSLRFLFAAMSGKIVGRGFYANQAMEVAPYVLDFAANHTPFVFAGPERYRGESVIAAYRSYYLSEKVDGNRWTNPSYIPEWLSAAIKIHIPVSDSKQRILKPRAPKPVERIPPVSASALRTPAFLRKPSN